jgi:formylglycine-generating enzyme required for sulfatase activity
MWSRTSNPRRAALILLGCATTLIQFTGCKRDADVVLFNPIVPDLPPPLASVLDSQRSLSVLPAGFLRASDGRILCERDGAEMILVPKTAFAMGSENGEAREAPVHRVQLSAFLADRHEVTNSQFDRFAVATGYRTDAEKEGSSNILGASNVVGADWRHPEGPNSSIAGRERNPVVLISWNDAKAYSDWANRRLLTEAEFEYCLRGGRDGLAYPWGNDELPPIGAGNFGDASLRRSNPDARWASLTLEGYDDRFERTAPVGSFPQNPLALFDVSGNVSEWCADWIAENYYAVSPERDPSGPSTGQFRGRRGGCWYFGRDALRCSMRDGTAPQWRSDMTGFRCAKSLR